jgi:iron(III) transport system substrate-binding protein
MRRTSFHTATRKVRPGSSGLAFTRRLVLSATLVIAGAVLPAGLSGFTAQAAEGDPQVPQSLVDAATKEGNLMIYHAIAQDRMQKLIDEFQKAYPGIRVAQVRAPGQQILQRFTTEVDANQAPADIFLYPGADPFINQLVPDGYIQKYRPMAADAYESQFTIPDYAYPLFAYSMTCAYNTDLVTPEEAEKLKHYEGWTDPIWKGRMAVTAPTGGGTGALVAWLMTDPRFGEKFWKAVAALEPTVFTSSIPMSERTGAGEFAVALNTSDGAVAGFIAKGAPLRFVYSEDGTLVVPGLMGLTATAQHPNAGKLFLEWALSKTGQTLSVPRVGAISLRSDINIPPVELDWWERPSNPVAPDWAELGKARAPTAQEWNRIFEFGGQ